MLPFVSSTMAMDYLGRIQTMLKAQAHSTEPTPSTAEDREENCNIRAMLRESVRYTLRSNNLHSLADDLYRRRSSEYDMRIINANADRREFWKLLKVVMSDNKAELEESMSTLVPWEANEKDIVTLLTKLVRKLCEGASFGRILTLIAFSGVVALKLEHRGIPFVQRVLMALENESDKAVHDWYKNCGEEEVQQRFQMAKQSDDEASRRTITNMAVIAGGALALMVAYAKS